MDDGEPYEGKIRREQGGCKTGISAFCGVGSGDSSVSLLPLDFRVSSWLQQFQGPELIFFLLRIQTRRFLSSRRLHDGALFSNAIRTEMDRVRPPHFGNTEARPLHFQKPNRKSEETSDEERFKYRLALNKCEPDFLCTDGASRPMPAL
jgi:hypothetical protein